MKPLPRYFLMDSKLIKVMHTKGKLIGQVIATGVLVTATHVLSKGTEITEKEFIKEKAKLLKSHKI